jgi:hypothetical protein
VSFDYRGAELWCGHCHCESCRRNTASPFTTFVGVSTEAYRFTGEEPRVYLSSPGVRRFFCGDCGTPIAYQSDRFPGEIHFYAASLEDPGEMVPQFHVHWSEKLPWIALADILPRHDRSSG